MSYMLGCRSLDNIRRQISKRASFLASIGISGYARSIRPDGIAGVVNPHRIFDADRVFRMEGRVEPLRAYELAVSLVVIGFRRVADGSGRDAVYEGARKGGIEGGPLDL